MFLFATQSISEQQLAMPTYIEASNDRVKQFLPDKFRLVLATDPPHLTFKDATIYIAFS
jgi:hypothetical protein